MTESGLRIRVSNDLREAFIQECRKQDLTAAQVLRAFMRDFTGQSKQNNYIKLENNK